MILNEQNYIWSQYCLLDSLAAKVFKKHNIEFNVFTKLNDLNDIVHRNNPDVILYGTGWQINFSKVIKNICRSQHLKSIALIDHWSSYKKRFYEHCLPNNILVMDNFANEIATKEFNSKVNILQIKNYFLEDIMLKFNTIKNKTSDIVVFISEPTTTDRTNPNDYEYKLLEDLLCTFDDVIIRLHPTENRDKYSSVISKFPKVKTLLIEAYKEDLLVTLSKSKLTIGLSSMALYISYLLGINTVSYVSNSGEIPTIPLPKEYILTDLKELKKIEFKPINKALLYTKAIRFDKMLNFVLKEH